MTITVPSGKCACGKVHPSFDCRVITGAGALSRIPEALADLHMTRVYILSDVNTEKAAGKRVKELLTAAGIPFSDFIFSAHHLEPDEKAVGSAVLHFDYKCDGIVCVGSGVLNDIGKIVSRMTRLPYLIAATAPSMDGYASATSSMARDGLKVSCESRCPDVIVGDTDILREAPEKMLLSGLGDMLAKYISIAAWRISHLINGEYYCETVADMVRKALKRCTDNASGLKKRDPEAVEAVFEGLILGGAAMNIAGVSRPASAGEHYMSHVWDMRGLSFGTPVDLHGIQCAIATLESAKRYEALRTFTPDREKAAAHINAFDFEEWSAVLRDFIGGGAEAMIALEAKEKKYDAASVLARVDRIIEHYGEILAIAKEEIPPVETLEALYDSLGMPKKPHEIGIDDALLPMTFRTSKDIRDKYVLARLYFDLGIDE